MKTSYLISFSELFSIIQRSLISDFKDAKFIGEVRLKENMYHPERVEDNFDFGHDEKYALQMPTLLLKI